jgi:hypothetical protein
MYADKLAPEVFISYKNQHCLGVILDEGSHANLDSLK